MPTIHSHVKLTLDLPETLHELVIAELIELDFEGFESLENQLIAWVESRQFDDVKREEIEKMLHSINSDLQILTEEVHDRNWNELWESTIQPIFIGKFVIRPTWSTVDVSSENIELIIDPKMSFGTGSHATTSLMLHYLDQNGAFGKDVLDAGTGTGILAIAAKKAGAKSVFAFDIDPWSEENSIENLTRNQIESDVKIACGGFEVIPESSSFDLILANIDSGVLRHTMSVFKSMLRDNGELVLSGLLTSETHDFLDLFARNSLHLLEHQTEKEWSLFRLRHS